MKIFKRISIAVAILVSLPFVVALFLKKTFVVEREVTINRPKQEVFNYLKNLKNHENFQPWARLDPGMKKHYKGVDGTVGFVAAWESDNQNVGKGEQELKKITDGDRIDVEIRLTEPFVSSDPAFTTTETVAENQTKVKSVYFGKMNYPTNLMCFWCADKVGTDMAIGLENLKGLLEKP